MDPVDFIVVGSGATGSMAAQTLVEHGENVLMLDAGVRDDRYDGAIPAETFTKIRHEDAGQHRFFLGDEFEAISLDRVAAGAQLTPPRRYLVHEVERFLHVQSSSFAPMESLAFGGLGSGWGLGCCVFSDAEVRAAGLDPIGMRDAYAIVASRIGISGEADDAREFTYGELRDTQPASPLDPTTAYVRAKYDRRREALNRRGFRLGRPALALLTQPYDGRGATRMREMEFYDDLERAAWRPWITIERLKANARFRYEGSRLVTAFREEAGTVEVDTLDLQTRSRQTYRCRRLVLASGVLGTARIVLRSLNGAERLPLLCNPYTYVPSLVPMRFGKQMPERASALAQLVLFHDPSGDQRDVAMASIYGYRSLLDFRLLPEMPLGVSDALQFITYIQSGLLIVGIHHPDRYGAGKYLQRVTSDTPTGDALAAEYSLSDQEHTSIRARERKFRDALRRLGAYAVRSVHPGYGSSIHYAGTLPFSTDDRPFSLAPDGRMHGTASVYVADGSGFTYLPAKSLTLSLMANAHNVARGVAR